jgi:hypothetical protein
MFQRCKETGLMDIPRQLLMLRAQEEEWTMLSSLRWWQAPSFCVKHHRYRGHWISNWEARLNGITLKHAVSVRFPSLWQNTSNKQLIRRKGIFWLTVLRVSVHESLGPIPFWPVVGQLIMAGPWQAWSKKDGPTSQHCLQEHTSNDLTSSLQAPPPTGFTTSQ